MAPEKTVPPTTCLVFLGIEIDSASQILRLPQEKLDKLKQVLHQWVGKKTCKRKELESLIGYLSHACKVVRPGRSFRFQSNGMGCLASHQIHLMQLLSCLMHLAHSNINGQNIQQIKTLHLWCL